MWFCLSRNEQYGPFTTEEAIDFVYQNPDCLVWQEGMLDWAPANSFSVLNTKAPLPPPVAKFHSDLQFQIHGDDMQYIEFSLTPENAVIAEPGSMIYKENSVILEAMLSGNRDKGLFSRIMGAGKRVLTGERAFLAVFTNTSRHDTAKVAFSAPYPGKIIPISLDSLGEDLICQKDSFLCAQSDIEIDIFFQKKILTALFGGGGFIMQRLKGNGVVFINAGGSVAEFDLDENETIQVDVGCLVAFSQSVRFGIETAGDIKSLFFGGSGGFFATLTGPGKVWVQSLPFFRLVQKFVSRITIKQK